jgi:hypothetical protein
MFFEEIEKTRFNIVWIQEKKKAQKMENFENI